VTTLVTVAGPVLGGFLADLGFWRGVFLINLPIGLFALWVISRKVPESRDDSIRGGIDWIGALLVTLGLGSLTYGFLSAPDHGFGAPQVWGALLLGAAALAGFGLREATTPAPMAPLSLFRSRTFLGTNLLTLFLYGALAVNSFYFSLNLVQVQGYSKTLAGLSFLPFTILLVLLSRWSGGLADRVGPRLPLVLGPAAVGLGFLWLSFAGVTAGPRDYWVRFFPGILLMGLGMGLTVAPLTTAVMSSAPNQSSGTASGINNAVSRTAGVLAIAITGALALTLFAAGLRDAAAGLGLPEAARGQLLAQAANLAGAQPPPGLDPAQQAAAQAAIRSAFADTFRVQMQVCTGLAWLSALLAALLVERKPQPTAEQADG
jgi:MFS family permease